MRGFAVMLLVLWTVACERNAQTEESRAREIDPNATAAVQLASPVASGPLFDDGLDPDALGEECGLIAESRFPDPIQLVREYLLRDADGEFLRAEPWLPTATLCPNSIPGYDVATLIEGFEIGQVTLQPDTVRVPVTYERIGEMSSGLAFEYNPRIETDTFTVVRTRYGWRIDGPAWWWQVSAYTALDRFQFMPEDRELIEGHVVW